MKIPTTKIIRIILLAALATAALAVTIPVFLTDRFTIRGGSMLPTLHDGQHVFVNKLLMGARIYTKYDFSDPVMESFRMPGLRNVRPGDIVIFNYPYPDSTGKIHFRINYVYAKRCIGRSGDTVGIRNGYYYNSSLPATVIGTERYQRWLSRRPDSVLKADTVLRFEAVALPDGTIWTIKDYGPLYIPGAGDTIRLTENNIFLYGRLIEYETGDMPDTDACFMLFLPQQLLLPRRGQRPQLHGQPVHRTDSGRLYSGYCQRHLSSTEFSVSCCLFRNATER